MIQKKYSIRFTARILLISLLYQLLYPSSVMALTTGPTQPEVQSFEPVGTTEMVDMFTGDFVYNIPLLDVEGYPINISYHGGVGMEQEASWVGLGWNINPGAINRGVRGLPDDFNGDTLKKEYHMKDEEIIRVGLETGAEAVGWGDPSLIGVNINLGTYINMSNYRGISADFTFGCGVNLARFFSAGVNIGVGSQSGASIDPYAGIGISSSQILSTGVGVGVNRNVSHGYNTRTALKDISLSTSVSVGGVGGTLKTKTIPISASNYVPVLTNTSVMNSGFGRLKFGVEAAWSNFWGASKGMYSKIEHGDEGASREAYGYMYSENANKSSIHDFTRDKDGLFNPSMSYLPMANMTYDVYSVSGQGTGGSFRAFRNDFGSVFDPFVKNPFGKNSSVQSEGSIGWWFAVGLDVSESITVSSSGLWSGLNRPFVSRDEPSSESLFENVYFKQAGEASAVDPDYWNKIKGSGVISVNDARVLPLIRPIGNTGRAPRTVPVSFLTADEAAGFNGVAKEQLINSYPDTFSNGVNVPASTFVRNTGTRKGHYISEMTQTQADGRRYVYGLPAMNNIQREATFTIASGTTPEDTGLANYNTADDSKDNTQGIDHYYSSTITPSHTHSYLLTEVLSTDYVDVKGDGMTDDDLGDYNKFNYTRKSADYRWRAPYDASKVQHEPGYISDPWDEKGSYVIGSREQWLLHSVESKNYIAEFYTSEREDGKGIIAAIKGGGSYDGTASSSDQLSYKLDSIKLYNKHDKYINKSAAVPVKTVLFEYDYSLCPGAPNSTAAAGGKLTLKKIYTRYGNSNKSIASPYQFNYSAVNPVYNPGAKDRWGNYKVAAGGMSNMDFPFVNQFDTTLDANAGAWSLTEILLPSGGVIKADYESDDYAYVQGRRAMEMFKIEGIGMSRHFLPGNMLYVNQVAPNLYVYFKRRKSQELYGTAQANYLFANDLMYFNAYTKLFGTSYEKIKGYAEVEEIGYCDDDYGYIKLKYVVPVKGKAHLNPISYTAINTARYNLPHLLYSGFDPSLSISSLGTVMAGIQESLNELKDLWKNPVVTLVKKRSIAQEITLNKSYIRLNSPGLKKKGGGHRIKSLRFYDSWDKLAGDNATEAQYGKNYDYTVDGPGNSEQSSGVASYEPIIGGDENPYRVPVPYRVQNASKFPPNDAIDLYQENLIGESLFPPPVVGYQKVTISSIHQETGRSSQGVDVYTFYTAKDYPIRIMSTPLDANNQNESKIFKQSNTFAGKQAFTITMNDMHGKPRSIEQYLRKVKGSSETLEKVKSKIYKYSKDNQVTVLEPKVTGTSVSIKKQTRLLGIETDITMDSRQKIEQTFMQTVNSNVNVSSILVFLIPIPLAFPWKSNATNIFRSATVTKVVQKYGILEEVEIFDEGALTKLKNEVFDPITGQPLITSINNEFQDKEYTVNLPAYWGYKKMGPAYLNSGYEYHADTLITYNQGAPYKFALLGTQNQTNFSEGDEVFVSFKDSSSNYRSLIGYIYLSGATQPEGLNCCYPVIVPKFTDSLSYTTGFNGDTVRVTDLYVRVIRSGRKNMLNEVMQTYTGFKLPFNGDYLTDTLTDVISISAKEFSESLLKTHTLASTKVDSYSNGSKGIFRVNKEYAYHKNRDYPGRVRDAGTFDVIAPWKVIPAYMTVCDATNVSTLCTYPQSILTASYMLPSYSSNWILSGKVSKWSPYSNEVENVDAVGNKSTAVYGYNEELPVAVAYNAMQGEVLAEGFEDYRMLSQANSWTEFIYSPFKYLFPKVSVSQTNHEIYDVVTTAGDSIVRSTAHSGEYSLRTSGDPLQLIIDTIGHNPSLNYKNFSFSGEVDKSYILSYWSKPTTTFVNDTTYTSNLATVPSQVSMKKSNIIDGWQQFEYIFKASGVHKDTIYLPNDCYLDDIRICPLDGNMKSFVYHPVTKKLMASLDENNYATFYEYDAEGNLVRTKRETEKGIITISESRSANRKQ